METSTGVSTTLNGIGHDGTAFFAVGDSGVIRRSTDGTTWTGITSGTTRTLYNLAYGSGRYVVGTTNSDALTSTNGTSWSLASLGFTSNSSSATRSLNFTAGYGFTMNFYDHALGINRLIHSDNGLTWTPRAGYSGNAQSILVTDDIILVGDGSQNKIRVFPTNPVPEFSASTTAVAYPGVAFHYDTALWGLTTPISAEGLPAGLTLNATTGTISGTVQNEGIHQVVITSGGAQPARMSLTLNVLAGAPGFITGSGGYPELRVTRGEPVDWTIPVIHPASSWRLSSGTPHLPTGLKLDLENGHITGTPTESGIFIHQFYAANTYGESFGSIYVYVADPVALISQAPSPRTATVGEDTLFSVETSQGNGVRFQWYFNGLPLEENAHTSGTRSGVLLINNAQLSDIGSYDVVVANDTKSELSPAASLAVHPPAQYETWLDQNPALPGDGTPLNQAFGDGISNLMRYALGLPAIPMTSGDYLVTKVEDGMITLTYVRPADRSDITFTAKGSRDLLNWDISGVTHTRISEASDDEWETWKVTYPMSPQSKGFLRLNVELITP